jgi:hypothetical protein
VLTLAMNCSTARLTAADRMDSYTSNAHVGHLVGECRVRLPVVRAHADEAAPAGQVPDQRPRFAGLIAGVEAASMEVQQDRRAGRPVAAVVYVQHAARPVAVGKAAHPDHVAPARENGACKIRLHGRSGLPALCNAACARSARHTTTKPPVPERHQDPPATKVRIVCSFPGVLLLVIFGHAGRYEAAMRRASPESRNGGLNPRGRATGRMYRRRAKSAR